MDDGKFIDATSQIVAAFLSKNTLPPEQVSALVESVSKSLLATVQMFAAGEPAARAEAEPIPVLRPESQEPITPAPPYPLSETVISDSVTPDYIVCFEDGKKLKMLKRHIRAVYDMSPEEYRRKWGLPKDYPMVAPDYAQVRRRLARQGGFGTAIQPRTGRAAS